MGKVFSTLRTCLHHSEHSELAIRYIAGEEIDFQNLEPSLRTPKFDEDILTEKVDQHRFCVSLLHTISNHREDGFLTDIDITIGTKTFGAHRNILIVSCPYLASQLKDSRCSHVELDKNFTPVANDLIRFLHVGECTVTEDNIDLLFEAGQKLEIECLVNALKPFAHRRNSLKGNLKPYKRCDIISLVSAIHELKGKDMFCDVTLLLADGHSISCHKNVLAATSPYFKGLFTSDMKEKNEKTVDFSFVKIEVAEDVIRYMYTGQICLTEENIFALLECGDFLLISQLKDKIGRYLEGTLALSNCLSICTTAKHYNCTVLQQTAEEFICKNFSHVSKCQEFLDLEEEHVHSLLSSDDIVASEAHVLEALIAWYRHDSEKRKESLKSLFRLIRLEAIPSGYMEKMAERYRLDIFQSFRKKTDDCYPFPRSKVNSKSKVTKPLWMLWNGESLDMVAKHYNLALFGITTDRLVCYWLPFGGAWSYVMSVPGLHFDPGYTNWPLLFFTKNTIYVPTSSNTFGYWQDPMERRCYEIFRNDKTAQTSSEMPVQGLQQFAAAVVGDFIYITGGTDWTERVEGAVQRYDLKKDKWEVVSSLREPRFFHTAIGLRRRYLYVLGGVNTIPAGYWVEMSSVEKYDSHTDIWSQAAPMKKARHGATAFVLHEKIFVAGGEGAKNTPCEIYDPITDEWHLATYQSLPETASNINDTIFFFDPSMLSSRGVLRMKFSTLNIETGDEQEVMSVTSWPHNICRSCIVPLSRGMMSKVLK